MDFDNKKIKVDEDEGSPLRNGANPPPQTSPPKKWEKAKAREKIESSAEALWVCHNPSYT